MKNMITIFFLGLCSLSGFCLNTVDINSSIDKVTVYPNGAAVHRSTTTAIQKGNSTIVINNLPLNIEQTSLNIWLPKGVLLLSQKFHREYVDVATLEQAHTQGIQQVTDSIALVDLQSQTLQGQEYMLNENRKLIEKENGMSVDELVQLNEFYGEEMLRIKKAIFQLILQKRALNEQLTSLTAQRNQDNLKDKKGEGQLILEVASEIAQTIHIKFNYFIPDAGWTPNYDLRVEGTQSNMQIIYKAAVFQNTGEDWDQVRLSLSTAEPVLDYTLPKLKPYYLNFNNYYTARHSSKFIPISGLIRGRVIDGDYGESLIGVNVIIKGTNIGTVTNIDGEFEINVPTGSRYLSLSYVGYADKEIPIDSRNLFVKLNQHAAALDEVVVLGYSSRSKRQKSNRYEEKEEQKAVPSAIARSRTSFTYEIDLPYSIPSTTNTKSVIIKTATVPATYEYITMPKITEIAFLTAKIDNWQALNLLPGDANIFLDNKYAGKTFLESDPLEESYVLSLGKDDGVIVQRTLQKDYQRKRFIGSNIQETRKWQLLVRNNKPTAINIRILDQYPIAKNNAIKIEVKNSSNAKKQKEEGLLTWTTTLSPTQQWKGLVEYQVKYPKSKRLIVD